MGCDGKMAAAAWGRRWASRALLAAGHEKQTLMAAHHTTRRNPALTHTPSASIQPFTVQVHGALERAQGPLRVQAWPGLVFSQALLRSQAPPQGERDVKICILHRGFSHPAQLACSAPQRACLLAVPARGVGVQRAAVSACLCWLPTRCPTPH